jgi:hypothetical protein
MGKLFIIDELIFQHTELSVLTEKCAIKNKLFIEVVINIQKKTICANIFSCNNYSVKYK